MDPKLKARCEANGIAGVQAERCAEAFVEHHLECIDNGECPDPCCPDECDEEEAKHGKAKAEAAATPSLRDVINRARASGMSWLVILQLLLQGLQALLDALKAQPTPAP